MIDEILTNDLLFRRQRIRTAICEAGLDGMLLFTDVNLFYLTGRVFSGYFYLPAEGEPVFFVRRPIDFLGGRVFHISKPESIPEFFLANGWTLPQQIFLETDVLSYNECLRLQAIFNFRKIENATPLLRRFRMFKTPWEIGQLRFSAECHAALYAQIRTCYRPGMTDLQLQAAIEYQMRLLGSIGVFRVFGPNMNIFMGSLLTGENAAVPSPFDFALGGGGQTAYCPVGANGTVLRDGMAVMVDMVGNYTAYLSDMTRVFSIGRLPEAAYRAHQVALEIQAMVEAVARPGGACADLYNRAYAMVEKAGLTPYFMGHKQQAKFIGHGIGLEINEPPVFAPRSKESLETNMTFALEPKFVIPQVGAVGIENSYLVTETGLEKLTLFDENIQELMECISIATEVS